MSAGMESRFAALRRRLARLLDNRVIAPRALIVLGTVYAPREFLDAVKTLHGKTVSGAPIPFRMPVCEMPAHLDRRHYEREWREGTRDA